MVDDVGRHLCHKLVGQVRPVGRHGVGAGHGAQCHGTLVSALVAHHAHALYGQKHHARLPNLVVKALLAAFRVGGFPFAQPADKDVVGILQHAHLLGRDVAENTHCQAGTGEGVARNEMLGHSELAAHAAHFVLKEPFERFAELQVHLLGQAAHVVVALDDFARDVEAFDAVGVDGALRQPFGIGDFAGLGVEHVHEALADNLALALRLGHAGEFGEELLGSVHADNVEAEALVVAHHVAELVLAQHAVVNEDTGEAVADGAVEEHGGHGTVHAARETEDYAVVAKLGFKFIDCCLHERGGAPVLSAAADAYHEVAQQEAALQAVEHLGVELHAPQLLAFSLIGGVDDLFCRGDGAEALGEGGDGVAVAHPYLRVVGKALEERVLMVEGAKVRPPVLAALGAFHASAVSVRHVLCAVADAENGEASANAAKIYLESLGVVHAVRRTGENDTDDGVIIVRKLVVGQDFAEGVEFAHAAAYELRGLRTEIEDNDFLLLHMG